MLNKINPFLIPIAAGFLSAFMQLSFLANNFLALFLLYFAPLPLLSIALSYGWMTTTFTTMIAAFILFLAASPLLSIVYLISIGIPSIWLGHLLSLKAQIPQSHITQSPSVEKTNFSHHQNIIYYPIERLLLWVGGSALAIIMITIIAYGGSFSGFNEKMFNALSEVFDQLQLANGLPSGMESVDKDDILSMAVKTVPVMAIILWSLTYLLNMIASVKITYLLKTSIRPPLSMTQMRLPRYTALAAALALAAMNAPSPFSTLALLIASALLTLLFITGLGFIHAALEGYPYKIIVLSVLYALILGMFWPAFIMIVIGIADNVFDFRKNQKTTLLNTKE